MHLRAVFFDVGQTLIRENPSRFAIYAQAARDRGLQVTDETMHQHMVAAHRGLPVELVLEEGSPPAYRYDDRWFGAFIEHIFGGTLGLGPRDVADVTAEMFARFEHPETFRVFAGARELLQELRARGMYLGVISNWSARLDNVLRALELDAVFDRVWCSALERLEKPDRRLFERAVAGAGVPAAEAMHIGDHPKKDVEGARSAGLQAVRIDHDGDPPGDPDRVVDFRELRAILLDRI